MKRSIKKAARHFLKKIVKKVFPAFSSSEFYESLRKVCCPHWRLPWSPWIQPRWSTTHKIVELEITEFCNLACVNCECCFEKAPSGELMLNEQIRKFVDESISLNWNWEVIKLRGGEPTLHPMLFQIIESLEVYRNFNPDCRFYILSNGISDKTKEVLSQLPSWITINNSEKKSHDNVITGKVPHDTINVAPIDFKMYKFADFTKGCMRTASCGMALSRYGYYPCATGIHISRIFGFDIGIKRLSLVDTESSQKILNILCTYCGHYKYPKDTRIRNIISSSWEKAFKEYMGGKPKISLY